ncbi:hypothetical protein HMPREF9166_0989 [Selenomonas sp. oral taxon 149 str. 67H29BP]|nr:hypothetical protein HMPREF9166_0989 [Selenomonas sp. oral taxon 149 str. 67H29BP]
MNAIRVSFLRRFFFIFIIKFSGCYVKRKKPSISNGFFISDAQ